MFTSNGIKWVVRRFKAALFLSVVGSGLWSINVAASSESVTLHADYAKHAADCGADCTSHFTDAEIDFIKAEVDKLEKLQFEQASPVGVALGLTHHWHIGRALITKCNALLAERGKRMRVVPGVATCFAYKKATDEYVMEINLSQLNTSRVGCILPGHEMSERTKGMKVYPVGSDANPGFIVLGHELCHALHFMDFEGSVPHHYTAKRCGEAFVGGDGAASQVSYEKRREGVNPRLWESRLVDRDALIWKDSEEQVTVIGVPVEGGRCMPQLSEFFLRLAAGRFPRYAYQRAECCFFEEAETVERLMYTLLGERWLGVLRSLPHAGDATFDEAVALDSQYSPWYTPPTGGGVAVVMGGDETMSPEKAAALEAKRQALLAKMAARTPPKKK